MMHFTENTEKYKIIKEIPANSTAKTYPERHVLYLATPKNMYCKKCKLKFVVKDKKSLAPIFDSINNTMYKIFVYKKRFECPECHCVKTVVNHPDFDKRVRVRNSALMAFVNPSVPMSDFAKRNGFSKSAGSKATEKLIKTLQGKEIEKVYSEDQWYVERIEELRKTIESYHTDDILAFIPFEFSGQWRCLVCTWDSETDDAFLLDMLESTNLDKIDNFNKRIDTQTITTVFCDANEHVITFMRDNYKNAKVRIARKCMKDALARFLKEKKTKDSLPVENVCQTLRRIITDAVKDNWRCRWKEWIQSLDAKQEVFFEDVLRFTEQNTMTIDRSFRHGYKKPFSELLKEIKKRSHLDFNTLRMKFLYLNHSHIYQNHTADFFETFYCMTSKLPRTISDLGVRISDLVEELQEERELCDFED